MMQDSVCAVIGMLLGNWLLRYDFKLVCLAGAVLFVFVAIFNACLLPGYRISTVHAPMLEGMRLVLHDQPLATCVLTLATCVLTLTDYYNPRKALQVENLTS
ncbi:MAG: Multidrug resistance protein MdtH [Sodalis sp.]|uniref:hypothetical protein n=1 Tax=Sodalis sp. (in: enterobacteria) TaxID=1898979 RepID=UPI003872D34F|nr:MAG: Multidrug resistance protein MdtH [Sodalis sp.]